MGRAFQFLSRSRRPAARGILLTALVAGGPLAAWAQGNDFFTGKTVDLYIGNDAGSSYDTYARLFARHIVRFIPGHPTIVPHNMPGAAGLRAMNYLYEAGRKDGTAWAAADRTNSTEPLLYGAESKAVFKNAAEFNWIGSLTTEIGVAAVWHTSGVTSWEEVKTHPVIVSMAGAQGGIGARVLNSFLGTQFQQVCCYNGDGNQNLAMERGEVEGRVGWSWSSLKATHRDWLDNGTIRILMQVGLQKNPEIPGDPPLVLDLAKSEADRKALTIIFASQSMGRPFVMPPGVPADRVAEVQHAFMDMAKDPTFLADADSHGLEITDPKSGEEIQKILADVYSAPPESILKAQKAMKEGEEKTTPQSRAK